MKILKQYTLLIVGRMSVCADQRIIVHRARSKHGRTKLPLQPGIMGWCCGGSGDEGRWWLLGAPSFKVQFRLQKQKDIKTLLSFLYSVVFVQYA